MTRPEAVVSERPNREAPVALQGSAGGGVTKISAAPLAKDVPAPTNGYLHPSCWCRYTLGLGGSESALADVSRPGDKHAEGMVMSRLVKALAGGVGAAFLLASAPNAAPLVLDDMAMSRTRTGYRLSEPEQPAVQSRVQSRSSVALAMASTTASAAGPYRPAARPDGGKHRMAPTVPPTPAAPRVVTGPEEQPVQRLSDSEADQVTAAGFLFPLAAAINVRAVVRPLIVFTPVARRTSFMRDVIVVPRPSRSMIVNSGKI